MRNYYISVKLHLDCTKGNMNGKSQIEVRWEGVEWMAVVFMCYI